MALVRAVALVLLAHGVSASTLAFKSADGSSCTVVKSSQVLTSQCNIAFGDESIKGNADRIAGLERDMAQMKDDMTRVKEFMTAQADDNTALYRLVDELTDRVTQNELNHGADVQELVYAKGNYTAADNLLREMHEQAIKEEREAREQDISDEADARKAAIEDEREARAQAISGEREAREKAVQAEQQARQEAINTLTTTTEEPWRGYCAVLANTLGGSCRDEGDGFELTNSGGLGYAGGGMDNDAGGYDAQNFCMVALYGENAASWTDKGSFVRASFDVSGGSKFRHIHGTQHQPLGPSKPSFSAMGMHLGGCCYGSWSRLSCVFNRN